MTYDYKSRLKDVRKELKDKHLDSLLVTNETNVRYLSGFTGNDSLLVITPDSQFFLTDSRYTEEAKETVSLFTIIEVTSSTYDAIGRIAKKNSLKFMGFESMNLPYGIARKLEEYIGRARLRPAVNIVESLRAIKDAREIELIKKSARLNKIVLEDIIDGIRPGVSEKALSEKIECEFIRRGAKSSFQTIVACGKNCSKPHAHPLDTKIAKDDVVMIDIGCSLDYYNSDMTRMVLLGRVKDKIKEIYSIVKMAQDMAIANIRPGRQISQIDSTARNYISNKGYGRCFGHSLGHGIGMDVHEEPSISPRNKGTLKTGMVFTVEPAIYLPGIGGVRIEDMVLVTKKGCEILTR